MATLTFPQKRQNVGHAELFHHNEEDLDALQKDLPEPPRMKISGRLMYFFWAGTPMDPDNTISWLALLRSVTRELALGYLFFVIALCTIGFVAPSDATLGALAYATISTISAIGFMTYRHTRMLPTQLNYALTFAEMPHFRIGPFMQLFYIVAGIVSAILAYLTVNGIVPTPVGPDWSVGGFSTGGALLYYLIAGLFYVFAFQHNQTLDLHTYYNKAESTNLVNFLRLAFQVGGIQFAIGFVGYFTGMWDVNPFLSVAACLSAGTCNAPVSGAWALRFFVPMVGGILSWLLQLWTWNQNSIPDDTLRTAAQKQAAAQYGMYDNRGEVEARKKDQGRKVDHM